MLEARSPLNNTQIQPKSGRTPLQPRTNLPTNNNLNHKSKPDWIETSAIDDSNKENPHMVFGTPTKIESIDASLAEELSAIRQKLERLRLDKDKTEKMLRERDLEMETSMKDLVERGHIQKLLEIEVDRLFRLKELKSSCTRISYIRSLREKQKGRKNEEDQSQVMNAEDANKSKDESPMWSPIPESDTCA